MEDRLNIPSITGTDLEFSVAGPGGRSYAFIIDWHIRILLALAWVLAGSLLYSGTVAWIGAEDNALTEYFYLVGLPALIIYVLYHPILETLTGRTPGKRIAGIRIATTDGQAPGIGAHLVRNIFRLVDSLPLAYLIGFTTTIVTEKHVRFGDIAAGTLLIYDAANEKTALKEVEAIYGSGLGIKESELIHEIISRWDSLDSQTRFNLGKKLLTRLNVEVPNPSSDDAMLAQLKAQLG